MGHNVESLDHLDTGVIEARGWRMNKIFSATADKAFEIHEEAMQYAEALAQTREVGIRPTSKEDQIFYDVYVKD